MNQLIHKGIKNKHHIELLSIFSKHLNEGGDLERETKYMGTNKTYYSISYPLKKTLLKDWLKTNNLTFDEYIELLNSLYKGKTNLEITMGGKLINLTPRLRQQINPGSLDKWLDNAVGWEEVDSLCQPNFTAKEMLSKWNEWEELIRSLSLDSNINKRRASLVLLTKPAREVFDSRIGNLSIKILDRLIHEKNILITKAISWLLRSMIKHYRNDVEKYLKLNEGKLPKIAIRETRNKLLTGKKN